MNRIMLDTSAYVAFKQGRDEALQIIRYADRIGVSTIVIGELLAGFKHGARTTNNRAELSQFLDSGRVVIETVTETTAQYYAELYAALRRKGKPVPSNDLWIAASALENAYALYTYDAHFGFIDTLIAGKQLADFRL